MNRASGVVIAIGLVVILITGGCNNSQLTLTPAPQPSPGIVSSPSGTPQVTPTSGGRGNDSQKPGATGLPPALPSRWSTRAPLVEANSEFALAELAGKIYVIGGYPSSRSTVTTVQVYDSRQDRWELITPLPQPNNHGMAAAANGKVYIIGGQTTAAGGPDEAGFLDTVFEYDPGAAIWTARAPMPTRRSAGATAVIGDKIYVAGGRPPRGNDFAVYDTRQNAWAVLPDLPTQRNHLVAAAIAGKVYVVGGRFGGGFNSEVTDTVDVYDSAINAWTKKTPMPTPRGGINGIAVDNCLYVWGGEGNVNTSNGLFIELESYNASIDSWKRLDPMPVPVHGVTGAAFINGWVHLPGGGISQGGSSGSTIHQLFRPQSTCN